MCTQVDLCLYTFEVLPVWHGWHPGVSYLRFVLKISLGLKVRSTKYCEVPISSEYKPDASRFEYGLCLDQGMPRLLNYRFISPGTCEHITASFSAPLILDMPFVVSLLLGMSRFIPVKWSVPYNKIPVETSRSRFLLPQSSCYQFLSNMPCYDPQAERT